MTPAASQAAPIDAIYAFGDSLSYNGNLPADVGARSSNGPVAVEYLAQRLGIAPANFHDYAVSGAESGQYNPDYPSPSPLYYSGVLSQVGNFLTASPSVNPNSLYVVWAGGNDFINALINAPSPAAVDFNALITTVVTNITVEVTALHNAGAMRILVPNLPDLASTPAAHLLAQALTGGNPGDTAALLAGLSLATQAYDQALAATLPGYVTQFDTFDLENQMIQNPGAFGLTNVTDPCFNGATVCANPDQYLFWDWLHPTTTVHAILGDAFAAAVPEPATLPMMALALLGLFGYRRQKTVA